jgi:hypothetical protein
MNGTDTDSSTDRARPSRLPESRDSILRQLPLFAARALVSWLLMFGTPAWAAASWGEPDCDEWQYVGSTNLKDWLLGYLSGMNVAWAAEGRTPARPLTALSSVEEPFVWMDRYCRANPRESIGRGAIVLFFELVRRKEGR